MLLYSRSSYYHCKYGFVSITYSSFSIFVTYIVWSKDSFYRAAVVEYAGTYHLGEADGCVYRAEHFPVKKVDVHDVCGAGDVFLAALIVRWLETSNMQLSIKTANNCASLSVTKLGCYTIKKEEYENLCV